MDIITRSDTHCQELHRIAYEQEKRHFVQLVATGLEIHREKMEYWRSQRQKAAALWRGRRNGQTSYGGSTNPAVAEDPPVSGLETKGGNGAAVPSPSEYRNVGVDCVRTYPDLSRHCLAAGHDLPLRLWYILRQHNSDVQGDGWLTERQVFDLSTGGQRQTKGWLKSGLGTFWHRHGNKYRLVGLGRLCGRLGVKLPKPCVAIPRGHLGKLQQFRAALYASWFVSYGDDGITISQATLGQLFNRSPRTLQRWAAMTGLDVTHNLATAPLPESKDDVTRRYKNGMPRYPKGTLQAMGWADDDTEKPNLVWFERVGDDLLLVWKMANTYSMAWQRGPKTTLQRNASKRASDLRAAEANVCKMYFAKGVKGGAVAKAIERQQGPVYLETGRQHPKTGEAMWLKQS
jgi:hypothetical protein